MQSFSRALALLRIIVFRALVSYPLLRALLLVVGAIVALLAGPDVASSLQSPVGVVLIAVAMAAIDIRRRGESLLWANLGYPPIIVPGVFGLVAIVGEAALAWLLV